MSIDLLLTIVKDFGALGLLLGLLLYLGYRLLQGHEQAIESLRDIDRAILEIHRQVAKLIEAEESRRSGRFWEKCEVTRCPNLISIFKSVEKIKTDVDRFGEVLDRFEDNSQESRKETLEMLRQFYETLRSFTEGFGQEAMRLLRNGRARD